MSERSRRKAGFTLIELLVTIVIVAILMSLLLPAISRMREQGRRAFCINNLKQLYMASILYAEDNNGEFPPTDWYLFLGTGRSPNFVTALYPNYIDSKETFFCLSNQTKYSESNLTSGNISYGYWGYAWKGGYTRVNLRDIGGNSEYWLLMDLLWMGGPPNYPIQYQDWYAHKRGSLVVRLDGSIKWYGEDSPTRFWLN